MNETYTLKEAMERLGVKSEHTFFQLERKYPDAFVVMNRGSGKDVHIRKNLQYHKATLDRFAERRGYIKQEKP